MTNYREKMREYLKEPNEHSIQYGKWGILNSEQRQLINRLLNEMDNADVVIKKQYEEKHQLISFLEDKIKEYRLNKELCRGEMYQFHKGKEEVCKMVLDFVNKGGKE